MTPTQLHALLQAPPDQFLPLAYQYLLGRLPDAAGARHYARRLQAGVPRAVIVAEIRSSRDGQLHKSKAVSPEFDELTARYLAFRKRPFGNRRWKSFARKYKAHTADKVFDWKDWAEQYCTGRAPEILALQTAPAPEENQTAWPQEVKRFLSLPDLQFIDEAYRYFLGREADEAGRIGYLNKMLKGADRLDVLSEIYHSEESRRFRSLDDLRSLNDSEFVKLLYRRLLGREADPSGHENYLALNQRSGRAEAIRDMRSSPEYRQKNGLALSLANVIEKKGGHRRAGIESNAASKTYRQWIEHHEQLSSDEREWLFARIDKLEKKPSIGIFMWVERDAPRERVEQAIDSLGSQLYPAWHLWIAASPDIDSRLKAQILRRLATDPRIHYQETTHSGADAFNQVLAQIEADYVLRIGVEDRLPETALYHFVQAAVHNPGARLIYADEDTLDENDQRVDPCFKPDYNPDLHLAANVIGHAWMADVRMLRELGGLDAACVPHEDWDMSLRALERVSQDRILHVPRILLHRRAAATDETAEARSTASRLVSEHLRRRGVAARVEPAPEAPACNRVIYELEEPLPTVSIIIPTRNRADLLERCIESIRSNTDYEHYSLCIVDNGSDEKETIALLKRLEAEGVRILQQDIPFNYSRLNNAAVADVAADYVCFLNNDTEALGENWLQELLRHAVQPGVGAVGARLWYPDGRLQHGGVITGIGGIAAHAHAGLKRGATGYFNRAVLQQTVSAVTGACMLVKRDAFLQVGGFDESLPVSLNDVDLCLKLGRKGLCTVWTPYAELIHYESASRGSDSALERRPRVAMEVMIYLHRWGGRIFRDPAYNPNLSLGSSDFSLSTHPRLTRFSTVPEDYLPRMARRWFPVIEEAALLASEMLVKENESMATRLDALEREHARFEQMLMEARTSAAALESAHHEETSQIIEQLLKTEELLAQTIEQERRLRMEKIREQRELRDLRRESISPDATGDESRAQKSKVNPHAEPVSSAEENNEAFESVAVGQTAPTTARAHPTEGVEGKPTASRPTGTRRTKRKRRKKR